MKSSACAPFRQRDSSAGRTTGYTLIELLTVMAVMALMASMTLVVISEVITAGKKTRAKTEMGLLASAIHSYEQDYGHFPISQALQNQLQGLGWTGDYTFGGSLLLAQPAVPNYALFATNNSEIMAILMNRTNYPATSQPTANMGHVKNSRQKVYLTPHMSGDTSSPGVGADLVYRDPWGNPYVISLDLASSDQCEDGFYSLDQVSGYNQTAGNPGLDSLVNPDPSKDNNFRLHDNVMIWSAGPDGKIDPTKPANADVNRDNVLGWQ